MFVSTIFSDIFKGLKKQLGLSRHFWLTLPLRWRWLIALVGAFVLVVITGILIYINFSAKQTTSSFVFKPELLNPNNFSGSPAQGGLRIHLKKSSQQITAGVRREGSSLAFSLPLKNSVVQHSEDKIVYADVQSGMAARYKLIPNGVKEDIIFEKMPESNILRLPLTTNNLQVNQLNQTLVFYDTEGNYQYHFEPPFIEDAAGNVSHGVSFSLEESGDTHNTNSFVGKYPLLEPIEYQELNKSLVLVITIDEKWLKSPDRVLPLTLDPTIIHDESSEFGGSYARSKDVGSGVSPNLEAFYQELPVDQRTVGLWHLNEIADDTCSGGEDACDSSTYNNHGTATGTTIETNNHLLGAAARSFNGSSYLDLGNDASLQTIGSQTIEMWVYPTSFSVRQNPFAKAYGGEGTITQEPNGTLNYYYGTAGGNASPYQAVNSLKSLRLNTWTHLAVVRDLTGMKITWYFNGEVVNEANASYAAAAASSLPAYIGTGYTNPYIGLIEEVRVSNVARSAEEVMASAQRRPWASYTSEVINLDQIESFGDFSWTQLGGRTGDGETAFSSASLVAQWNFNESSGTTAAASVGSCGSTCNGTLTNFTNTTGQDVLVRSGWTANNRRWGAGALMFDGVNDYVNTTNITDLNGATELTISLWLKAERTTADQIIVAKGVISESAQLVVWRDVVGAISGRNNIISIIVSGSSTFARLESSSDIITDGDWHHVVVTYKANDSQGLKLYIDGVEDQFSGVSTTSIPSLKTTTDVVRLGASSAATPTNYFSGMMDAVQIYTRTLPSHEIISILNPSQIQLQTRTSANGSSWEGWSPTSGETSIDSLDSPAQWEGPLTNIYSGALVATSSSSLRIEGDGSLEINYGGPDDENANAVGIWNFDETNGDLSGDDIFDTSGNNLHGEIGGTNLATAVIGGISNKAREFNGSDDYIEIDNDSSQNAYPITISFWLKTNSNEVDMIVNNLSATNYYNGYSVAINNGGLVFAYQRSVSNKVNNPYTVYGSGVSDGKWHHVAAVVDASGGRLYLDGKNISSNSWLSTPGAPTSSDPLLIGKYDGDTNYFAGSLDELQILNQAFSAEEVAETYRLGRDHYLNRVITSTDLSDDSYLVFDVAGDEPGTYLQSMLGESAHANYQLDANTVGLWHFEEESGSGAFIKDSSGNGNHGTPVVGTFANQGIIGKARRLDGTDDYISVPENNLLDPSEITLEAWIKPSAYQTGNFINKGDNSGYRFVFSSGGVVNFLDRGATNTLASSSTLALNTWHHVAVTGDSSGLKVYVNGKLDSSKSTPYGGPNTSSALIFGRYATSEYFAGSIDEIRISNVARTPTEIRQAYEVGRRTHPITIDFGASLDSANLIANSSDTSFVIDATTKGLAAKGKNLFIGDTVIVREKYAEVEYIAQGEVVSVNESTGAVVVVNWDAGSTFPAGGYTQHATVFKWQSEYWNIAGINAWDRDAVTNLNLRLSDSHQGRTVWLDNLRTSTGYLENPLIEAITSTAHDYFQYRAIFSTANTNVSAQLNSVTLEYTQNFPPNVPSLISPTNSTSFLSNTPTLVTSATDTESDRLQYQIEICTDVLMSQNCQTYDQTISTTGWSATDYASGAQASYTVQTPLAWGTTYFWRSSAIDPAGSNTWGDTQEAPYSFITNYLPVSPTQLETEGLVNPSNLSTITPEFSAIFNDPDDDDTTQAYQIQLNTTSNFEGSVLWDSGKITISTLTNHAPMDPVVYSGSDLSPGGQYYWRIRFWDSYDLAGAWSSPLASFSIAGIPNSFACVLEESIVDNSIVVRWQGTQSPFAASVEIERSVDRAAFASLTTVAGSSGEFLDSPIAGDHIYQYRLRYVYGSETSGWCTTDVLSLQSSNSYFEGLNFEDINID